MLKADRIELAILNLIIDWSDADGRWFNLLSLQKAVLLTVDGASMPEVIDAFLTLIDKAFIAYNDVDDQPYHPSRHERHFYGLDFRCRALPPARRRQQELSRDNKEAIFIIH